MLEISIESRGTKQRMRKCDIKAISHRLNPGRALMTVTYTLYCTTLSHSGSRLLQLVGFKRRFVQTAIKVPLFSSKIHIVLLEVTACRGTSPRQRLFQSYKGAK